MRSNSEMPQANPGPLGRACRGWQWDITAVNPRPETRKLAPVAMRAGWLSLWRTRDPGTRDPARQGCRREFLAYGTSVGFRSGNSGVTRGAILETERRDSKKLGPAPGGRDDSEATGPVFPNSLVPFLDLRIEMIRVPGPVPGVLDEDFLPAWDTSGIGPPLGKKSRELFRGSHSPKFV